MRRFVIIHISDLHVGRAPPRDCETLINGVLSSLSKVPKHVPRVLVVTGDIVDRPTKKALATAQGLLAKLKKQADFSEMCLIRGNHDKNKWLGSFVPTRAADTLFREDDALLQPGGQPWNDELGLHIFRIDSCHAELARGAVPISESHTMVEKSYDCERTLPDKEKDTLVRIVALHHHPLPLADAEGGRLNKERFLYLKKPARFLDACRKWKVNLVLHGHAHAKGLASYALEAPDKSEDNDPADRWSSMYVISCPSSTGVDCTAGFNLISFYLGNDDTYCSLQRWHRPTEGGPFEQSLELGYRNTRMPLPRYLARDRLIDVEKNISMLDVDSCTDDVIWLLVQGLFTMSEFFIERGCDWRRVLYVYMVAERLWGDLFVPRLGPNRKTSALVGIQVMVGELKEFVAQRIIGADSTQLKGWCANYGSNEDNFLQMISTEAHKEWPPEEIIDELRYALRKLDNAIAEEFRSKNLFLGDDI